MPLLKPRIDCLVQRSQMFPINGSYCYCSLLLHGRSGLDTTYALCPIICSFFYQLWSGYCSSPEVDFCCVKRARSPLSIILLTHYRHFSSGLHMIRLADSLCSMISILRSNPILIARLSFTVFCNC